MIWLIYAVSSSTVILVHILAIIYSLPIYLLIFSGMSNKCPLRIKRKDWILRLIVKNFNIITIVVLIYVLLGVNQVI